jgi:hypothetical protein
VLDIEQYISGLLASYNVIKYVIIGLLTGWFDDDNNIISGLNSSVFFWRQNHAAS